MLERALELEPGDVEAWAHLGFAYMRGFQPKKGFDVLRKGIERTGSDLLRATLAAFTPDEAEQARLMHEIAGNDEPAVRGMQRMARGNTLFTNRGDGGFDDASEAAGVTMGRWAWGSRFADLNNDGWQDLVVANGFFTGSKPDDL